MSRVLPILFNGDMVRAIIDGRKTVTRRVVKLPKYIKAQDEGLYTLFAEGTCYENQHMEELVDYLNPPYQPGDILYVRESVFQGVGHYLDVSGETVCFLTNDFEYYADGLHEKDHWKDKHEHTWMHRRPSIHMPKEAARIWLKVKDVRVERLKEITEEQAKAEGAKQCYEQINALENRPVTYLAEDRKGYYVLGFKSIWNSTIKKSDLDRYGWDANPWVWVIEFERCEKPEKF